jgi:hypothetical protein
MKYPSTLTALVLSLLCSSCAMLESSAAKSRLIDRPGLDVVLDHSTGIGFVISDPKFKEQVCKTPAPDVLAGVTKSEAISLPSLLPGSTSSGAAITDSEGYSATNLGGRTPSVLIARDFLYRVCEMSINMQLSPEETVKVYLLAMDKIVEIIKDRAVAGKSAPTAPSITNSPPVPVTIAPPTPATTSPSNSTAPAASTSTTSSN